MLKLIKKTVFFLKFIEQLIKSLTYHANLLLLFKAESFVNKFRLSLLTNIVFNFVVYKNNILKVSVKTIINEFILTDFYKV